MTPRLINSAKEALSITKSCSGRRQINSGRDAKAIKELDDVYHVGIKFIMSEYRKTLKSFLQRINIVNGPLMCEKRDSSLSIQLSRMSLEPRLELESFIKLLSLKERSGPPVT